MIKQNLLDDFLFFYQRSHSIPLESWSHRLYRILLWKLGFVQKPKSVGVDLFFGQNMTVYPPEDVSRRLQRFGFHDAESTVCFIKNIEEGQGIIDIGAHFGYFTLLASCLVGDKGEVHAFEPTPSTYDILIDNTGTRSNITANRMGIYDQSGEVTITDYGLRFSAFNTFKTPRFTEGQRTILDRVEPQEVSVKCVTIDSYCEKHAIVPSFIKIDAEGSEAEILEGANETLTWHKPTLLVEVGGVSQERSASRELVESIIKMGYQAYYVSEDLSIIPYNLSSRAVPMNLLFKSVVHKRVAQ
jgi:FkbM family methyltransferase